jgi:hypothetical protein
MQHEAKASGKVGLPYLLVVRKVTKDNHTDKGGKAGCFFLPYRPDTVLHLHRGDVFLSLALRTTPQEVTQ